MSKYEDEKMRVTLSGRPPAPGYEDGSKGAPDAIDSKTGMHLDYWVLPEEERQKGFVRPYRQSYTHLGERPKYPIRDLTEEELAKHSQYGYDFYEEYPEGSALVGRYWKKEQLTNGCGSTTTMGSILAETYARDPTYYGATFCANCRNHFPVRQFVWAGTTELVGS